MSVTPINSTTTTTNAVSKERVLAVISGGSDLSATAIAQAVGYARKNATVDGFISQLVAEGAIVRGASHGAVVYNIPAPQQPQAGEQVEGAIATNDFGYGIEYINDPETGALTGYTVVTPEGESHELTTTERIVVVNEDPDFRYKVERPEDLHTAVIHAVNKYSRAKSIRSYIIRDLSTQSTLGQDLQGLNATPVVIFIRVIPENKAGLEGGGCI